MSLDYSRLLSLFIELAGNLRSYRWSCNAATANNSRKQLCNSVLNVKAVLAVFNQERALVGAFYVIINIMDLRFKL